MGKLREQMVEEMESRNFSPKTIKAYLGHMVAFTRFLRKSPAEMGEDEIRRYLQYLRKEKQVSWSNINIAYCALKFFLCGDTAPGVSDQENSPAQRREEAACGVIPLRSKGDF